MTVAERLVGAWRLVSFETRGPGDAVRYPFGRDATGLLVYTATGHMSGQLMRPGRPVFASSTITSGTEAELSSAARGYVAYAGTYTVNDADGVVTHHVTMSLFPNLIGTDQRRVLVLDGDTLELSTLPEAGRTMTLRWQRTSPNF